MGYAQSRPDGVQGVFVLPLAEIVAQAPYDSDGKLLKVLPKTPRGGGPSPRAPGPVGANSMTDDLVFHASADYETSDEVEFPLDRSGIVLITPQDGREIQIPDTLADRVRVVTPAARQQPVIPEVGSAIYELQQTIASEYNDELVVPLRVAGLNYEPERPTGVIKESTRFRRFGANRELTVGDKQLERVHSRDNL